MLHGQVCAGSVLQKHMRMVPEVWSGLDEETATDHCLAETRTADVYGRLVQSSVRYRKCATA